MTRLDRIWRHLNTGTAAVRRAFPPEAMRAIEDAVRACESRHGGEVRFAVEDSLPFPALWRKLAPRERAIQVFAELRVWDTAHNNGVLIYLLLADHDVEIVADRGVARAEWESVCRVMEDHFRNGRFREGALAGIAAVSEILLKHPPASTDAGNELPDTPALL